MTRKIFNILVLCTGNSARSIMAEALTNVLGGNRFHAYSAGSHPAGQVHPFAIQQALSIGYPISNLRSKSWEEFTRPSAPRIDLIITVCDNAAGEMCPTWPGTPLCAHWSIADPTTTEGSDDDKRRAFEIIFRKIASCVECLVNLPVTTLDNAGLLREINSINPGVTGGEE